MNILKLSSYTIIYLLIFSNTLSQGIWYNQNLQEIEDVTFELNVMGFEDDVWQNRLFSFIELRLMEHGIEFVESQMPKMVVDINILDSRIEEVSSYFVMLSVYNYSVSEEDYYRSMSDTLLTRKFMTSKVFSHELIGQTSSKRIHRDVEKSVDKIISIYLDIWYQDNPFKQF